MSRTDMWNDNCIGIEKWGVGGQYHAPFTFQQYIEVSNYDGGGGD
jgi:hypothetical protein